MRELARHRHTGRRAGARSWPLSCALARARAHTHVCVRARTRVCVRAHARVCSCAGERLIYRERAAPMNRNTCGRSCVRACARAHTRAHARANTQTERLTGTRGGTGAQPEPASLVVHAQRSHHTARPADTHEGQRRAAAVRVAEARRAPAPTRRTSPPPPPPPPPPTPTPISLPPSTLPQPPPPHTPPRFWRAPVSGHSREL